jgi:ABC-type dipeptide/oligopeptide/nickel transport system permease component
MLKVILRRFISLPFVILSITFVTFVVGYLAPGDPILSLMGNQRNEQVYQNLRERYGLDRPWHEQYLTYLAGLTRGDLGLSYRFAERPVWDIIRGGVPVSLLLGLSALALSLVIGIPLGITAALNQNSTFDRVSMAASLALYAVPSFVLIPIFQWINYQVYRTGAPALPAAGWGRPEHWIMPILVLSAASMGYIARLSRSSVVEVVGQDYVRTAHAKGLTQQRVRFVHILRNAILPIITVLGPSIAFVVTGSFVVESLFSIPGIGFLAVEAIGQRDYPVIQGTTVILAAAVVIMNLITDLAYTLLDPRIRVTA